MRPDFDIARARAETRSCEKIVHFNNAGAALPPAPVIDALFGFLREEEAFGGYETMSRRSDDLENFYHASARLLNCSADEIAFSDSATRAWATAFYAFDLQPGDQVLVGSAEYGSNLVALLHQTNKLGIELVPVPDDVSGQIDVSALQRLINKQVKLICLTHIPSGNGLINPAEKVGSIARAANIPFLLDACQAIGQLPLDVEQLGCDILCATGRKFLRGPRGTGLLYVRKALIEQLEPNQLNHHSAELLSTSRYKIRPDAKRFECWERSYAGQVALAVAIDYALGWGLETISERIKQLATDLRQKLTDLDAINLTDRGLERCGIVTFYSTHLPAEQLQQQLLLSNINTSIVPFSANPISTEKTGTPTLLRASLHYYNTGEEIQFFVDTLKRINSETSQAIESLIKI
jgi:selenocysteine lyase/cysteine desulfurase